MSRILASADIGSNTVHLLIAETDGHRVSRIDNRSEWLALGESVARRRQITATQASQLATILAEYRDLAKSAGASELYVFATEAVRAAENHEEVLQAIGRQTKLKVDLVTPRREAELSVLGAMLDSFAGPAMTVFEVGGGSAQIACVIEGQVREEWSFPIGTGRIIAEAGLTNPAQEDSIRKAKAFVDKELQSWTPLPERMPVVACGGVARGLWRSVHPDGEREIAREEIQYLMWASGRLSVSQIAMRFGCKLKRAATLLPGSIVYGALMDRIGCDEMVVSQFGVREGAILSMYSQTQHP